MKARIVTLIPVIVLTLLLISAAGAQTTDLNTIDSIRANVNLAKANVAHLAGLAPLLAVLAFLSIVLGGVAAVLHAASQKQSPWVRWTTVVIGALVAMVGTVKTTFWKIDYSTCESAVSQVSSVIQLLESDLSLYSNADLTAEDRDKTWMRIVRNEGLLEDFSKLLRESGETILPTPAFLTVVHAQSQTAQQSVRANYAIQQTGTGVANNRKAANQYAKYRALEALASQAAPGLSGSGLNTAIDYFNRFAEITESSCNGGSDQQTLCQVKFSVSSAYLRADVINRFVNWASKPPEVKLRGSAALRPDQSSLVVTVDEAGKPAHGSGKFQFTFGASTSGKVTELRLKEIQCSQDGRWIFEVTAGGQALTLPLNQYDDGSHPTVYSVWNDNRTLHFPAESAEVAVTIAGYGPPASAK